MGRTSGVSRGLPAWIFDVKKGRDCPKQPLPFLLFPQICRDQLQHISLELKAGEIVAIAGIDTRKLTRILREKGAQGGCIVTAATAAELNAEAAVAQARILLGK